MAWGFGRKGALVAAVETSAELPEIYPLSLAKDQFVNGDVRATYVKILTDVMERTSGVPEEFTGALWDNCLASESQTGLVSLLADAMVKKADLFLVFKRALKVIREATYEEQAKIRADYATSGASEFGVYVSFKNFGVTDMLALYALLEYLVIAGLYKTINLTKAVQVKVAELRASVALADAELAVEQAKAIAQALRNGQDVMLDAADSITTATADVGPVEKAISFIDGKRAWYLNLPVAYVSGLRAAGLSDTGEADMRAIERGLKHYWLSIAKPVLDAVFDVSVEFKSQDFRAIDSGLEVLKTFELVSDDYLSGETKRDIVARHFDVDPEEEATRIEDEQEQAELDAAERRAAASQPTALTPADTTSSEPTRAGATAFDDKGGQVARGAMVPARGEVTT